MNDRSTPPLVPVPDIAPSIGEDDDDILISESSIALLEEVLALVKDGMVSDVLIVAHELGDTYGMFASAMHSKIATVGQLEALKIALLTGSEED